MDQKQLKEFLLSQKKPKKIGLLGDFALDRYIYGSVSRISPEAPVPVLHVQFQEDRLGCAANVALNMASLGDSLPAEVHVFGALGCDFASKKLKKEFSQLKNFFLHLSENAERTTPVKTRFIAGAQHQLLRVDEEELLALNNQEENFLLTSLKAELPNLDALVLQDYAKGVLNPDFLVQVIALANENKVKLLVDPHRKTPLSAYRGAYLLKPNQDELSLLLEPGNTPEQKIDEDTMLNQAKKLFQEFGIQNLLLTQGKKGMSFFGSGVMEFSIETVAQEVFDVTGAGDTVLASFVLALAHDLSFKDAATVSNHAASIAVSKVGSVDVKGHELLAKL